ncbi:flagellar alpha dynein [Microcoleus sp. D2_18a_B4]|uniref:flagellar alpha dynein n=1 Tax=Microcoleus sp. D2_18a_B4 TaxID=3055329 RepID=UPI002FCF392F
MKAANKQLTEWDKELNQLHERNGDLGLKVQMLEQELKEVRRDREEVEAKLAEREVELSDLRQKSKNDAASKNFPDFPEAADLLNRLRTQRKTTKVVGADINAILGLLADENGSNPV